MFSLDKWTDNAKAALQRTIELAQNAGHPELQPAHLLSALLQEEGMARTLMEKCGVDPDQFAGETSAALGRLPVVSGGSQPATSAALAAVFSAAQNKAQRSGHAYITAAHLLWALLEKPDGVIRSVFTALSVDPKRLRDALDQMLAEKSAGEEGAESRMMALDRFGRDLTAAARAGELDPVIGRDEEIRRVMKVLSRRTKNNPVLIGEPGVGKTAVAEGLAQRIASDEVPETIKDKQLYTLDLAALVAGSKYRGEFEDRLKKVMKEIRERGDIILFVDEMHTLVGAGAAEGAIDAASIIKPALARGELQTIGATTLDEYRKYVEKDPALERRFQPIQVGEPSVEETVEILKGLRDRYEAHHRVSITDGAINAAATLADRYISDRFLPDKAIDLIDEAGSKMRIKMMTAPPGVKEVEDRLRSVRAEKEAAIEAQEFEKAAALRDDEKHILSEKRSMEDEWLKPDTRRVVEVTEKEIAEVVSMWTGVPVTDLTEEETAKLLRMEAVLHERIVGQDEAVTAVSKAIRRARAGLKDPRRPAGSFIFLGPSGVGKTELSKALADFLFGTEEALISLDMSEYMEKHTVSRLIGSPPGYVGFDEGGQLTEQVRRKPYSVILFDEIEKAHPDVFNVLLQILEEGRLTDAQGRKVDFKNAIVIMTSNIGARDIVKNTSIGFQPQAPVEGLEYGALKSKVTDELKKAFRPEFLNRVDEVIVFHDLIGEEIEQIVDLMISRVRDQLMLQGMGIALEASARTRLASEGFDPALGARPLRRAIQRNIEDPLSEQILAGMWHPGDIIETYIADDGEFAFRKGKGVVAVPSEPHPEDQEESSVPPAPSASGAEPVEGEAGA
ncbi:MAG: AAA family ATPase [Coriobacteriales bacterium]|nr:AAA family ATPase [Coriobacteriales bacterium]